MTLFDDIDEVWQLWTSHPMTIDFFVAIHDRLGGCSDGQHIASAPADAPEEDVKNNYTFCQVVQ